MMQIKPSLVSIIIINFNSGKYLERCLSALAAQTYSPLEVIVVDNGSTDGSTEFLRGLARDNQIQLSEGPNRGSSKANNLGIHQSSGEFVLILNADAYLVPSYIEECIAAMRDDPQAGTAIGKLVSAANPSIIDSAGLYIYREGLAVDRGFGEPDKGQFELREYVDGACCAAAIYRRTMLEEIRIGEEFYRESFFAFCEDVELSFRASVVGWKTVYVPTAVAHHVRGGSSQNVSEFACFLNERNLHVFLRTSFNRYASVFDRVLQRAILGLRSVRLRSQLSPERWDAFRSEVKEISASIAKANRSQQPARSFAPYRFSKRRSFLWQTVIRRLPFGAK